MSGTEDLTEQQPTMPPPPPGDPVAPVVETLTIPMSKTRAINSACLFVGGAFSIAFGVLDRAWIIGGVGLALVGIGLAMYAKTEVTASSITVKRLIGGSTTERADIAGVGLDFYRQKAKKYWYPVVQTHSGNDLDITAMASPLKENASKRALEIMTALGLGGSHGGAASTDFNNPNFGGTNFSPTAPKPSEPEKDPFEEFNLTSDYEQYLLEKAEEEAAAAAQANATTPPAPPADATATTDVTPTLSGVSDSPPAQPAPSSPVADHSEPIEWPEAA